MSLNSLWFQNGSNARAMAFRGLPHCHSHGVSKGKLSSEYLNPQASTLPTVFLQGRPINIFEQKEGGDITQLRDKGRWAQFFWESTQNHPCNYRFLYDVCICQQTNMENHFWSKESMSRSVALPELQTHHIPAATLQCGTLKRRRGTKSLQTNPESKSLQNA